MNYVCYNTPMNTIGNNYLLWENDAFTIRTPFNPHVPYAEGAHLIVAAKNGMLTAWENPEVAGSAFEVAAKASKIMKDIGLAPWFNIQANGNWQLLPDATLFFHIHIYARNKTDRWAKPIILPEAPKTYHNDPMPEADRETLHRAFAEKM
jgi:hypothetical protein